MNTSGEAARQQHAANNRGTLRYVGAVTAGFALAAPIVGDLELGAAADRNNAAAGPTRIVNTYSQRPAGEISGPYDSCVVVARGYGQKDSKDLAAVAAEAAKHAPETSVRVGYMNQNADLSLRAARRALEVGTRGCNSVVLVGHSINGQILDQAARSLPAERHVDAVVQLSTPYDVDDLRAKTIIKAQRPTGQNLDSHPIITVTGQSIMHCQPGSLLSCIKGEANNVTENLLPPSVKAAQLDTFWHAVGQAATRQDIPAIDSHTRVLNVSVNNDSMQNPSTSTPKWESMFVDEGTGVETVTVPDVDHGDSPAQLTDPYVQRWLTRVFVRAA